MSQRINNAATGAGRRYTGSFVVGVAVCVAIVSFILGTRGSELLAVVGPRVGINVQTDSLDVGLLQETYRVLSNKFDGDLDPAKMTQEASRGLVESAGDPYTKFFTAEEAAKYDDNLAGRIGGGIGAEMGLRNKVVTVLRVLEGSPAEKAGLRAADIVATVNDESTEGKALDEVVGKIRGEVGSTVKLDVIRSKAKKTFTIERAEVTAPDIRSKVQDGIGVITVSRFDKQTGVNIRAAADDFKRQNVKGVVLDLRANGGGYLEAGVDTASVWLGANKVVVSERRGDKVVDELKSSGASVLGDIPTVVLIDEGTASASEIVAGALKDYGKATLIGQKTFGKGSVQALIELSNGSELKVTVARWYTPNGKNINKQGIEPDVKAELTVDDVNASRDPQMDAAIKKLTTQ